MLKKILFVPLLAVMLVGATGPFSLQAAGASSKVDVFISFRDTPGAAERALVEHAGGTVRYSYSITPAVAASMPEAAIQGLLKNPKVTSIESDDPVYATDAELDNSWGVKRVGSGTVHA